MTKRRRRPAPALAPFLAQAALPRRIEEALEAAVAKFGSRPEVAAVDYGYKWTARRMTPKLCLRIHLREKHAPRHLSPRERIPRSFRGIPTDVIEDVCEPHQVPRTARAAVIRPGLAIGTLGGPAGTLGLLVRDADDGARALLTAGHVLADEADSGPGDPVVQPSRFDGAQAPDTIAAIARVDFATDAGLARLLDPRPAEPTIEGTAIVPAALRHPAHGLLLEKSGRSTGVTRGVVDGITLHGWGLQYVFHIAPLPGAAGPLAEAGDSGAVWYDPVSGDAVGLHCQGSASPTPGHSFAVATALTYVFPRLRVTL